MVAHEFKLVVTSENHNFNDIFKKWNKYMDLVCIMNRIYSYEPQEYEQFSEVTFNVRAVNLNSILENIKAEIKHQVSFLPEIKNQKFDIYTFEGFYYFKFEDRDYQLGPEVIKEFLMNGYSLYKTNYKITFIGNVKGKSKQILDFLSNHSLRYHPLAFEKKDKIYISGWV